MRAFYCIAILLLLTLEAPVCAWAQAVKKEARGSITGRVTIDGKAASGIKVELFPAQFLSISQTPVAETVADQSGRFRLEGLNGGTYRIAPVSPDCFITEETDGQRNKIVAIKDGQAIEGADVALSRGAVITGRVLDADGEPIIAGVVSLSSITEYS